MAEADNFGEVERTFRTKDGERVSKVRTSRGGTLYFSEESGQLNQQEYSAKSSQRPEVKEFSTKETSEIDTNNLSQRYQAEKTFPIGDLEPGSVQRERVKQQNMFVGFLLSDDTPNDRAEAIKQYEEMQKRLRNADDPSEERDIKDEYNIGGS